MARTITISFKEITSDIKLFCIVEPLEDRSTQIKELIRLGLKYKEMMKNGTR